MKMLKKWFANFIKDIEKANQESFGNKKPDCCGLNSNQHKNLANHKNEK
jgi:hypothetical protein